MPPLAGLLCRRATVAAWIRGTRRSDAQPWGGLRQARAGPTQDEIVANDPDRRLVFHPYADAMDPQPTVLCYTVDEILAEKTRALYERQGLAERGALNLGDRHDIEAMVRPSGLGAHLPGEGLCIHEGWNKMLPLWCGDSSSSCLQRHAAGSLSQNRRCLLRTMLCPRVAPTMFRVAIEIRRRCAGCHPVSL